MKYGLLTTTSMNIGDEIQCLAAFRFLPQVDYLIHRERIDQCNFGDSHIALIMSHWWLWSDNHFPPSDCIDPLYISFHLQYRLRNEEFLSKEVKEHFKKHEPISDSLYTVSGTCLKDRSVHLDASVAESLHMAGSNLLIYLIAKKLTSEQPVVLCCIVIRHIS